MRESRYFLLTYMLTCAVLAEYRRWSIWGRVQAIDSICEWAHQEFWLEFWMGRKLKKDRIIFLVCCYTTDSERLSLLILRDSWVPKCFGWKQACALGYDYKSKEKSWINRDISLTRYAVFYVLIWNTLPKGVTTRR